MSTGAVFFAHKRITERNLHLAGEASGSSISNGCQAKTEHRRQLAGVGTGRGGTKLHTSVAGSRVTAFLATAAPWEPSSTDNPRICCHLLGYSVVYSACGQTFRRYNYRCENLKSYICLHNILSIITLPRNENIRYIYMRTNSQFPRAWFTVFWSREHKNMEVSISNNNITLCHFRSLLISDYI
jgi:hypothetical protein